MKYSVYLAILLIYSIQLFAQKEIKDKYRAIPSKKVKIKENLPVKTTPEKEVNTIAIEPDAIPQINPDDIFKNDSIYKKESNSGDILYRRNQFLGQFKTTSVICNVRYRDAAFVDGDKIRVHLNDKVIEPEVNLVNEFQGFNINLVQGINKVDFEALNEGFAAPNTAEFQVFDHEGKIIESSQWNVGTGYKATILIVKE